MTGLGGDPSVTISHLGIVPGAAPQAAMIWTAQASSTGTQTLTWTARTGEWMVVVMNGDAAPGLIVQADTSVTIPALPVHSRRAVGAPNAVLAATKIWWQPAWETQVTHRISDGR